MSANQVQATVTAKVWQSIAQSGVDVSSINRDTLNKLVDFVVDAALQAVDDQFEQVKQSQMPAEQGGQTVQPPTPGDNNEEEVVLWEGRPYLSLTTNYIITNERIRIIHGLIGKDYEDIELIRVQDVDFKQSIAERAMNLGDVYITSHDPSHPNATLENVKDPKDVHEILRRAVIKIRQKYRLGFREEM